MSAAQVARDEALGRVEGGSDPRWVAAAERAVIWCANRFGTFTSDEVWDRLEYRKVPAPREPRALGPVMKRAVRDGLIEPAGYVQSARQERHCAPVRVYRLVD